ncbi:MAG TPA: prolipoprotein diacylglyceryl transferase [Polyangiaceae bacterium]
MPKIVWEPDPVFMAIGAGELRYYSLCFMLLLVTGYALLAWQVCRGGGDREEAGDFSGYGILGVLVGARAGHVFWYDFEKFTHDPAWALKIWTGGLASHGAAIGLAVAMYWFTKRRAIPFLEGCDRLAPAIPPGALLCRLGNLMNSEIVGKPTDQTWGFQFPRYDFTDQPPFRHPTQLYEMLLAAVVFAIVLAADRRLGREARPRGALTGILLVTLFTGRFVVEFFKEPQGELLLGLNRGQLLSAPLVLIGVVLLVVSVRRPRAAGWVVGGAAQRA